MADQWQLASGGEHVHHVYGLRLSLSENIMVTDFKRDSVYFVVCIYKKKRIDGTSKTDKKMM